MNARCCFGSRIIETDQGLTALCWGEASADEDLARPNRERLRYLRKECRLKLPAGIEQQAAVECERHGR